MPEPPTSSRPSNCTIRVRLFASLREAMGWNDRRIATVEAEPTPLSVWRQLDLALQEGPDLFTGVRVAINQGFATPLTPLKDGDELAFLPPITGG